MGEMACYQERCPQCGRVPPGNKPVFDERAERAERQAAQNGHHQRLQQQQLQQQQLQQQQLQQQQQMMQQQLLQQQLQQYQNSIRYHDSRV